MKKTLRMKFMLLLFALVVGSSAWADETLTLTATNLKLGSSYPSGEQTQTVGSITFKYTDLMQNNSTDKYIQAKASTGCIYNSTPFLSKIKSVAITHSGTARQTTILGSADGVNWTSINSGSGSITGDFTSGSYYYFKITRGSNAAYWTQVVVTYEASTTYTITCATGLDNGSIASNVSEAAENDDVTITATPSSGYKLSTVMVTKDGGGTVSNTITGNTATFKMPADNVTVTATFVQCYTITCATGLAHGSISADMATAAAGETVTITASPDEGYDLSAITVTNVDPEDIIIDGNAAAFEMPASDVTVSATFTAKTTYAITTAVTPASSGTITTDANAWEGKTLNVSVSPAAGYIYSSIAIKKTGDSNVSVPYSGNATNGFTFTMPAYAVTITATFATADIYALYSGALVEGDYVIYYNGYAMKNTVSSNRLSYSSVTPANNQIVNPDGEIVWHIAPSGNYWTIYNESVYKYAASTGVASKAQLLTSGSDDMSLWTANGTSTYEFVNKKNTSNGVNANLRNNGTYGFACYATGTGGALSLYRKAVTSTMAVASADHGTITATPAGGSAIAEGGSVSVASGKTITLNATGDDDYVLDAWAVYKTDDASTKVTVTSNTFTMPDYGVTVSASFRLPTTFTVQYSVNGAIDDELTINVAEGSPVTLPTSDDVTAPSGYAFAGWTENAATGELISGSTYTPTASTTLYLVFIKSGETLGYNKVTSDLGSNWAGEYLIAYSNSVFADGRIGGTGTNAMGASGVKADLSSFISGNNIHAANGDTYKVTLEEISSGSNTYVLMTQDGKYNYNTSNSSGLSATDNKATAAAYPITITFTSASDIKLCLGGNASGAVFRYNTSSQGYFRYYANGGQEAVYLYKKTPVYTLVKTISGSESMTNIEKTYIITVANGGVLTLSGTNNANAAHLVIEDGGQLVTTSSNVQATFKKTIATSTNDDAHWYTISSPVTNTVSPADPGATITSVSNLVNNNVNYNLYRYVENAAINQWESYNPDSHNDFVTLLNGHGYLYRNNGQSLTFTGKVNVGNVEVPVTAASSNNGIKGFNLLGNPYSHDITLKHVKTDEDEYFYNCYILSGEGSWTAGTLYDGETSIKPCQGFFVQADESATATISKNTQRGINANGDFIKFTVANNEYKDVAYAIFDKGQDLTKINHRNANIQQIYIPKDGENFAVATMADNIQSFNLNFKAMTMGQYTLGFKAKGEFNYLHVIDRMTGNDIDMLLEGEYSFIGSPQDNEARFIVRLGYLPNYDNNGEGIFAYQNGNNIIVSGEGELQIFDVMGRMVSTQNVSGTETISVNAQGVYIFRLVGTEIKTQKIVVK